MRTRITSIATCARRASPLALLLSFCTLQAGAEIRQLPTLTLHEETADEVSRNLETKWLVSRTASRDTARGKFESRIFERFAHPDSQLSVYLGHIVFYRLPKGRATGVVSSDELTEKLRLALGISHWTTRTQGPAQVFEAFWPQTMRYLKIFVSQDKDSALVSVSSFRFAYADSAYAETELIQRRLAGEPAGGGFRALDGLFSLLDRAGTELSSLVAPVAWAQAGCTCLPGDQLCAMQCLSQNMSTLTQSVNKMSGATNNAANAANSLNGTIQQANGTAQQINQTAQDANRTAQQINKTAQDANRTAQQINKTAQDGVQEWHRTNDIAQQGVDVMKSMTDPLTVAALSATAVLSGMAIGLVVDGISAAGSAVWEAFTHAQRDKRMLDEFKYAVAYYTKYQSQAAELERDLDKMLYFFDLAKKYRKNREQLLDVATLVTRRQKTQDDFDALTRKKTDLFAKRDACLREYGAGITDLRELRDAFSALPLLPACDEAKLRSVAKIAACDAAARPRVMKSCYGELDKLIKALKARRAALPDSQLGCEEGITLEIAELQSLKKTLASSPTLGSCTYQLNAEIAVLQSRRDGLPGIVAACTVDTNRELLKLEGQLGVLDTLKKFETDLPSEIDFCKTMRSRLNGLKKLEYNLMAARSSIYAGLKVALRDKKEQDEHIDENYKLGSEFGPDALDEETKAAVAAALRNDKDYSKARQDYVKYCIDTMSPRLFGLGFLPKATQIPIVGGTYLAGDDLFSKKGKSVIDQCVKTWQASDYHKRTFANARTRIAQTKEATAIAAEAHEYMKANENLIRGDRSDMIGLYDDVIMETACVNGAPPTKEVEEARLSCGESGRLPADFLDTAKKQKIDCQKLLDGKVFACSSAWYHREGQLVSFLDSKSEDLTAACGL